MHLRLLSGAATRQTAWEIKKISCVAARAQNTTLLHFRQAIHFSGKQ